MTHIIDRKKKLTVSLFLLLFSFIFGISPVLAKDYNRKPRSTSVEVNNPHNVVLQDVLTLDWHKNADRYDLYYRIEEPSDSDIDFAKYIMVKTPYANTYQNLEVPRLFLAKEDDISRISFKIMIDREFWNNISNGTYKILLVPNNDRNPGNGNSVNFEIELVVNKSSLLTITADNINIVADRGPGIYSSQEPASITINHKNKKWQLSIEANPLNYQGDDYNNSPTVSRGNIYMSIDNPDNYINMENIYYIDGRNYSSTTTFDLYFQIDVGNDIFAGDYSGEVILTVTAN